MCAISMSGPLKCLVINNKELENLFAKSLAPENLALIRRAIHLEDIGVETIKKISRCFVEREFPANTVILQENTSVESIFIIKDGICQVYSDKNPLKSKPSTKNG